MCWRPGPLPLNTWQYGGVVTAETEPWFAFADFRGDHAVLADGTRVEPEDVLLWTNCIEEPPVRKG